MHEDDLTAYEYNYPAERARNLTLSDMRKRSLILDYRNAMALPIFPFRPLLLPFLFHVFSHRNDPRPWALMTSVVLQMSVSRNDEFV